MAIRIQLRHDTSANWELNNPTLREGEFGIETDTLKIKVGPVPVSGDATAWTDITNYVNLVPSDFNTIINGYVEANDIGRAGGVVGLDNTKNAIIPGSSIIIEGPTNDSYETTLTVTDPTADRTLTLPDVTGTIATEGYVDDAISAFDALPTQTNNSGKFLTTNGSTTSWGTVDLTTKQDVVSGVSSTEIGYLDGVTSKIQDQLDSKLDSTTASTTYQGIVSGISNTEIGYLDGVTSKIQDQLDDKLSSSTASSTYQTIVSGVSNTEIGYLDGVTSSIQTQIGNKQDKVSGVSDTEIGYLDGVTSSIQTQLNAKAPLASPTFTGSASVNDLAINGTLTFNGTATTINSTNLEVTDSIIYLSAQQYDSDILDIGLYGAYGDSNAGHFHTGLIRDASDGKWKLFSNGSEPVNNVVNLTGVTYDTLKIGTLEGNVTGNLTGDVTGNVSGNAGTVTNGIYTTDTGTVTNTMLAGSIANAKLSNSKVTVGTTDISLGSSATAIAGITTINSTTIPTSKTLVVTTDKLSVHAATSSSELAGIISDETGSGSLVFGSSPTLKGPIYIQSAGGAGGSNNYLDTNSSTGTLNIVSGYPMALTASGNITLTATGGAARVGSDTIATLTATQTLTGKTISGASNTLSNIANSSLTNSSITINGTSVSLGGSVSIDALPTQTNNSGKYLTTDGSTASWASLVVPIVTGTATVDQNTAKTVDTTALSAFTSIEYMVSLKQGSKVRTSKVLVQTDGTSVDMTEFAITETGGTIAGVVVSATTSSTNCVLQVTATDGASTNVAVKFSKVSL